MKTKIVHCKKEKYDVYIGRGKCPISGKESKWSNPYTFDPDSSTKPEYACSTRKEAVEKYMRWFFKQNNLVEKARKELKGKVLGCWCNPRFCHGHFLAQLVEKDLVNGK